MSASGAPPDLDLPIRYFVYKHFIEETSPPTIAETAEEFGLTEAEAKAAYQRLHQKHFFFLDPGTTNIRMANPLSAIPTKFKVQVDDKSYWANCAWDMLGIPAMLQRDATIEALFEDTQEKVVMMVKDGQVQYDGGVVHFPLPFQQWYGDLILT
jgi:hypothetical protein